MFVICCLPATAQSRTFSGSASYNYQNSDQEYGSVQTSRLVCDGSIRFNDHFSVVGEMDSYYGRMQGASATQQNFVAGPQYTFRADEAKVRPYLYVQAGDRRSSSAGNVEHAIDLQLGGGLQVKPEDSDVKKLE